MPKIPEVSRTTTSVDIGSNDHALAVARVLAGTSKREDTNRFLTVVRRYFRQNKAAEESFREWYSEVPSEDGDEDRPTTKKKGKRIKAKRRVDEDADEDDD